MQWEQLFHPYPYPHHQVTSVSHVLADGHTYYMIHNMLAPGSDVGFMDRSLVDISREASRALGDAEASFLESDEGRRWGAVQSRSKDMRRMPTVIAIQRVAEPLGVVDAAVDVIQSLVNELNKIALTEVNS